MRNVCIFAQSAESLSGLSGVPMGSLIQVVKSVFRLARLSKKMMEGDQGVFEFGG